MAVKIYFAGSIQGGRQDVELYRRIIAELETYGNVLTKIVADPCLDDEDLYCKEHNLSHKEIHDQDMEWLRQADVMVTECTQPSHGVGYEIGRAIALKKKVLCLFRPESGKKLSAMIRGAENGSTLTCKDYKEEELPEILKNFFRNL